MLPTCLLQFLFETTEFRDSPEDKHILGGIESYFHSERNGQEFFFSAAAYSTQQLPWLSLGSSLVEVEFLQPCEHLTGSHM